MIEGGVSAVRHGFVTVIAACAKAGRPGEAEVWLQRMEEVGGVPDVIAYSSAIDASSKAGDPEGALRLFKRMVDQGVRPNVVAYSSLARPFARKGDWATVEGLRRQMEEEGLRMNEYFLFALLDAYANCKPRKQVRAEKAFRDGVAMGLQANEHVTGALRRVLGHQKATEVLREAQHAKASSQAVPPWRR